jgi:cell division protein FtsX
MNGGSMSEKFSALAEFSRGAWAKTAAILTVLMVVLGAATAAVTLYGQSQTAAVKAEIARNANLRQEAEKDIAAQKARIETQAAENATLLEKAKAEKATADAAAAKALADNAKVKQEAENKLASQKAIVEAAIAKYAERTKRAEADKKTAEAVTAQEVAKNSEVKFKAEAEKAELEALETEHMGNMNQWINNCADARGGGSQQIVACSMQWSQRF